MEEKPLFAGITADIDAADDLFDCGNQDHQNIYRFFSYVAKEKERKGKKAEYLEILEDAPESIYDMVIVSIQHMLNESDTAFAKDLKCWFKTLPQKMRDDVNNLPEPKKKSPKAKAKPPPVKTQSVNTFTSCPERRQIRYILSVISVTSKRNPKNISQRRRLSPGFKDRSSESPNID